MYNDEIKFEPTYTINRVSTIEGKGKKKRDVFQYIKYVFKFRSICVQGVLSKNDIERNIPSFESLNIDFYSYIVETIIVELLEKGNAFATHIDPKPFLNDHYEVFDSFVNELKTIVKENSTDKKTEGGK